MQVPKPSDEARDLFRSLIPQRPGVEVKPMFGNLGAFVNGNMFAALLGPQIGVRLVDEATRSGLQSADGAGPFGPDGRPMREYVALPSGWGHDEMASWVARALDAVADLSPKELKARKGRA